MGGSREGMWFTEGEVHDAARVMVWFVVRFGIVTNQTGYLHSIDGCCIYIFEKKLHESCHSSTFLELQSSGSGKELSDAASGALGADITVLAADAIWPESRTLSRTG